MSVFDDLKPVDGVPLVWQRQDGYYCIAGPEGYEGAYHTIEAAQADAQALMGEEDE